VVERRQASAPDSGEGGASRHLRGASRTRIGAVIVEQRLPAFRFLYFVIASAAKQSSLDIPLWIASSLRSSQ